MTIITLPSTPSPNHAVPHLIDAGIIIRPSTGAPANHIARAGSRWAVDFSFPPMKADTARVFISRIAAGTAAGLRVNYPLLGLQGSPGVSVAVRGSGAAGTALPLKGLPVGYVVKEGYWLTVTDTPGAFCLHTVRADVTADTSGNADVLIYPPLRNFPVDGNGVFLQQPTVDGIVTSQVTWELTTDKLIQIGFTLEELA